jgi:hypothetical protein
MMPFLAEVAQEFHTLISSLSTFVLGICCFLIVFFIAFFHSMSISPSFRDPFIFAFTLSFFFTGSIFAVLSFKKYIQLEELPPAKSIYVSTPLLFDDCRATSSPSLSLRRSRSPYPTNV